MASNIKKYIRPVYTKTYGLFILVFCLHQLLEYNQWSHMLMRSYFDDLMVLPILLPFTLALMRLIYKNHTLILGIPLVTLAFVMMTVVFEFILPNYSSQYTRDYLDPLFYFSGGVIYLIYEHKKIKN